MSVLNGLNEEEIIREMERMVDEIGEKDEQIELLKTDKEEMAAQIERLQKQISQLTDYAEALNTENSEDGVKKLKEDISRLKGEIRELEGRLQQQKKLTEELDRQNMNLERTVSAAQAAQDRAERNKDHADAMRKVAEQKLMDKPLTVEKTVYQKEASCVYCTREELQRKWRELEGETARRKKGWMKNTGLLILLVCSYLVFVAAAFIRSHALFPDLCAAGKWIWSLPPSGWYGWAKVLVLIVDCVFIVGMGVLFHFSIAWGWKDDAVYGMILSIVICFADALKGMLHCSLPVLMLALLGMYIVGKIVVCIIRNG